MACATPRDRGIFYSDRMHLAAALVCGPDTSPVCQSGTGMNRIVPVAGNHRARRIGTKRQFSGTNFALSAFRPWAEATGIN